jgi:hypothetical protein
MSVAETGCGLSRVRRNDKAAECNLGQQELPADQQSKPERSKYETVTVTTQGGAAQYVTGSTYPLHYPAKRQLHSRKPNPVSTSEVNITTCEQLTILTGTEVNSLGHCLYSRLAPQGYCDHKTVDIPANTLEAPESAAARDADTLRHFRPKGVSLLC